MYTDYANHYPADIVALTIIGHMVCAEYSSLADEYSATDVEVTMYMNFTKLYGKAYFIVRQSNAIFFNSVDDRMAGNP